jgi:hypothetical protein
VLLARKDSRKIVLIAMSINKTLGDVLYRLFGENGSDQMVGNSEKRLMDCYKELERHGLVDIEPHPTLNGVFRINRKHRLFWAARQP